MVRAQSKYGLMGSSAKTGKNNFPRGHGSSFWIKLSFGIGIGHPQLYIKYSVYVSGRAQGSQIFKWNSIISIRSKVMAFLVILLSPWSPRCPRHPHIVPVISASSLCRPCHPHIVLIAPRRSPCGPHGCGLRGFCCLHPMLSPWSPWYPHGPHHPHVIPTSSPCCSHHPHIVPIAPRRSPCCPLGPRGPHVVPVVPTSSPSSPCCPHHPHVIPIAPRRSPCGPHGCGLRCLHPMLSPCCPRGPQVVPVVPTLSCVIPVIPTSSKRFPHHP